MGLRLVQDLDLVEAIGARATLRAMRSEIFMLQAVRREARALAEAAVEDGRRAQEFEAIRHAYTALDGAYQMLGQPERAVHERMSLDLDTRPGDTRARGILELNLGVQAYAEGGWAEARSPSTSAPRQTCSPPVIAPTRRSQRPIMGSCS